MGVWTRDGLGVLAGVDFFLCCGFGHGSLLESSHFGRGGC